LRKWWVENKKSSFFLRDLFFWIVWQMMERDKMEGNEIGEFYGFFFFFLNLGLRSWTSHIKYNSKPNYCFLLVD
jgi:hypothetical protein